jgi:ferric enterobactin receptor
MLWKLQNKRCLFENKADKLVFNAENDASIAGGDATDVLRKVPTLSVDLNGNVSLRGSQNVRILINGKPSGMFSSNVADALKMFPADQIKKVEVITSPSAKYDAEGSAGLINIITKKADIQGVPVVSIHPLAIVKTHFLPISMLEKVVLVQVQVAHYFIQHLLMVFHLFSGKTIQHPVSGDLNQMVHKDQADLEEMDLSVLFMILTDTTASIVPFNFRGFGFDLDGSTVGTLTDPSSGLNNRFTRTNTGDNFFGGFDWNTDYTRKFEKREGQELSFGVQYSKQNNNQDFTVKEIHSLELLNRDTEVINKGTNHETTMQVDYTHPFTKTVKLETGAKAVIRNIISDYTTQVLVLPTGYQPLQETFNYDQDVYSGYASMTFNIAKKYSVITGVRYEKTEIAGRFKKLDSLNFSGLGYNNLLPNFTISRTFKGFRTLKLGYSQRLQRPSLQFINPFNNNADFLNRVEGNPYLDPEIVQQVELGYNFTYKGFTTFSSLFYKHTDGIIEQILSIDKNGLSVNTFKNVVTNNSIGFNTFCHQISKTCYCSGRWKFGDL